eukprot:3029293-Prymnesium_polylepis.2
MPVLGTPRLRDNVRIRTALSGDKDAPSGKSREEARDVRFELAWWDRMSIAGLVGATHVQSEDRPCIGRVECLPFRINVVPHLGPQHVRTRNDTVPLGPPAAIIGLVEQVTRARSRPIGSRPLFAPAALLHWRVPVRPRVDRPRRSHSHIIVPPADGRSRQHAHVAARAAPCAHVGAVALKEGLPQLTCPVVGIKPRRAERLCYARRREAHPRDVALTPRVEHAVGNDLVESLRECAVFLAALDHKDCAVSAGRRAGARVWTLQRQRRVTAVHPRGSMALTAEFGHWRQAWWRCR